MITLNLLNDNSEIVSYNFNDFKVRAKQSLLSDYPGMAATSHWHTDLEFIIILNGKMTYNVNGYNNNLAEGQAIFVNSGQMHYGFSLDGSDCSFICILLHPSLFSSLPRIKKNYIVPLCTDFPQPFSILKQSVTWQRELIEKLKDIFKYCQNENIGFELQVLSIIYSICYDLYNNLKKNTSEAQAASGINLQAMHDMIGYIQKHYQEKISLHEIANAGNICRSSCCNLFQQFLHKTPISYLTEYRLEKSLDLVQFTNLSMTDIALQCGFTGSSYFTEIFHKKLGCTPSQYRKKRPSSK